MKELSEREKDNGDDSNESERNQEMTREEKNDYR